MNKIQKAGAALLLAANMIVMGGCAAELAKIQAGVHKYAPIVGKDLIMIGDILVTAECSPALAVVSETASNILTITAPDSKAAASIKTGLSKNLQVAAALCPVVEQIKSQVGSVPDGAPTQVVTLAK